MDLCTKSLIVLFVFLNVEAVVVQGVTFSLHSQMSWTDAKAYCEARGEVMYSQSELGKWADLKNAVVFTNPKFWVGLKWSASAGEFQWTDGTSVTTDYWRPGQPDNTTGHDCALQLEVDGHWETAPCATLSDFVCEAQTTNPAPITPYPRPAMRRDSNAVMWEGLLKGFACAGGLILVVAIIMHLPCCRNWVNRKEANLNSWREEGGKEPPVMEPVSSIQTY